MLFKIKINTMSVTVAELNFTRTPSKENEYQAHKKTQAASEFVSKMFEEAWISRFTKNKFHYNNPGYNHYNLWFNPKSFTWEELALEDSLALIRWTIDKTFKVPCIIHINTPSQQSVKAIPHVHLFTKHNLDKWVNYS